MEKIKAIATAAARETGRYLRENIGKISQGQIKVKQKFDFVTEIDRQAEKMIIQTIGKAFPDHQFYAEETARGSGGGYRWIIDPLDGTTNYIHGLPHFSISIALEYKGEIIFGLVFDPILDELFTAEKNKGAFLNDKAIHVSQVRLPEFCLLATGFPFRNKHLLRPFLNCFHDLFVQVSGIRRIGSAAIDLCNVACGRVDGFWEIGLSPWDIAAGHLIIAEAGGRITDFAGDEGAIWNGNTVASNGLIHDMLLRCVGEHLLPVING